MEAPYISDPEEDDEEILNHEGRVILHIDLDCFYAQVESIRLGISQDEPLAVNQWGSLIAVNYAAKKFSISRGDTVESAVEKCPHIHLPHVETIGDSKSSYKNDRNYQKASLRRYREASTAIFEIFRKHCPDFEKGGIDEVFMDVTKIIKERSKKFSTRYIHYGEDHKVLGEEKNDYGAMEFSNHMINQTSLDIGALISSEIRKEVFDTLGYTCSSGIATNKLLAKLASPMNKPNGQMMVPPNRVQLLLQQCPIRKMRGFGGKLGKQLLTLENIENAIDLQRFSLNELEMHLKDKNLASFVFSRCRGYDEEAVKPRQQLKSLISSKQFPKGLSFQGMKYWINMLSNELMKRIEEDMNLNNRIATKLIISYATHDSDGKRFSKSMTFLMPNPLTSEQIITVVYDTIEKKKEIICPCYHLMLLAKEFRDLSFSTITNYFTKQTTKDRFEQEKFDFPVQSTLKNEKNNSNIKSSIFEYFSSNQSNLNNGESQSDHKNGNTAELNPTKTKATIKDSFPVSFPTSSTLTAFESSNYHSVKESTSTFSVDKKFTCDQCHKEILLIQQEEHQDYHMAFELQQKWRREQRQIIHQSKPLKRKHGLLDRYFKKKEKD